MSAFLGLRLQAAFTFPADGNREWPDTVRCAACVDAGDLKSNIGDGGISTRQPKRNRPPLRGKILRTRRVMGGLTPGNVKSARKRLGAKVVGPLCHSPISGRNGYCHNLTHFRTLHEPALNERRSFELARIREETFTGASFAWPKGFLLKKHLAGAFGRFIGEPVHAVRVAFDREYVPFVRERPWQPGQHLVERTDGSAEATYEVCHTADLEQNILSAGGQVEVIDPPEVRERIRAAAAKVIARPG